MPAPIFSAHSILQAPSNPKADPARSKKSSSAKMPFSKLLSSRNSSYTSLGSSVNEKSSHRSTSTSTSGSSSSGASQSAQKRLEAYKLINEKALSKKTPVAALTTRGKI
ncbi:MAG: hypothetical protein LQ340_002872 [Diploschistes diacapsis]|nr:MAG: hypothetical protein LQ340_002872 [Diploschistes diacapsis]